MAWLCKIKIWWKSKFVLYGYKHFYCIHKNRLYLKIHLRKSWDKVWYLKLWLDLQIRPLPKGKKKGIGLMKYEWGGKCMIKFVGIKSNTYSYLIDSSIEVKMAKDA